MAAAGIVAAAAMDRSSLFRDGPTDPEARTHARAVVSTKPVPPSLPFSIFWITDTQFLSESNPELYVKMTKWIVDRWSAYNGKIVVHTGDVVQTGTVQSEWQNADAAMSVLLENGIPYTWCAGNHDDIVLNDPSSGWYGSQWTVSFNPTVVKEKVNGLGYARWVGDHHDGMNTAVAFSADNLNLLIISVEWNADKTAVLKWVQDVLDDPEYADHRVIIAPHAYINQTGSGDDPTWGAQMSTFMQALTGLMNSDTSRIFLTLNGHFPTDSGYHTPSMTKGRNELMFDRQDSTDDPADPLGNSSTTDSAKVGGATVTILTFHPEKNSVRVRTYDAYTGEYRDGPQDQFDFVMFPAETKTRPVTGIVTPAPLPSVTRLR